MTCVLYLIDFERGKYSHALLDICKLMVGKIEMKTSSRRYFINSPNFPIEFAHCYRGKVETYRNLTFDDGVWQVALSSALIYSTLSVFGDILDTAPRAQPLRSIARDLKWLMERLTFLLEENDAHQPLKRTFARLAHSIY